MKKLVLFIIPLLFSCQYSEQKYTSTEKNALEIRSLLDHQIECWNKGDIDGFMEGYWKSEKLRFMTKKGTKYSYDSVLLSYKKNYPDIESMGELSFGHLEFAKLAKKPFLMQVSGKWKIIGNKPAEGTFSLIFQKFDKDWKIILDHTW